MLNKPTIFSELIVVNLQPLDFFLRFSFLQNKRQKNEKRKNNQKHVPRTPRIIDYRDYGFLF